MSIDSIELMKIMDFMLENRKVVISKEDLFTKETLAMIRAIVKNKIPNNFELTLEQVELLKKAFIKDDGIFNEDTPQFILEDEVCAISSIQKDLNSIVYLTKFTDKVKGVAKIEAKKQNYILSKESPDFLKMDLEIIISSAKISEDSVNFALWNNFDTLQQSQLVDLLIKQEYVLTCNSPAILKGNRDIILSSIKKDIRSADHISSEMKKDPEIFKSLLIGGYFYDHELANMSLSYLKIDDEVMDYFLNRLNMYNCGNHVYNDRIKQIVKTFIYDRPLIKDFDPIFYMLAELEWSAYKGYNHDKFANVFGKICSQLQGDFEYDNAVRRLSFFGDMLEILDNRAELFNDAVKKYHLIWHDETIVNKIEQLQPLKDLISKSAALYISKSKEEYKKELVEKYRGILNSFFELDLNNPTVQKKIIQARQKQAFRERYLKREEETMVTLNGIKNKYIKQFNQKIIDEMIDMFVYSGYTDISRIFIKPEGYVRYRKFEEVLKLINRLNNGYILFDGIEVRKYKHLIAFDEVQKKYYYIGEQFSDEQVKSFEEYKQLSYVFRKIQKDIMIITKKLQVDKTIGDYLLKEIAKELPFTDENYQFKFNKELDRITFAEFLSASYINHYDTNSLINNDSYIEVYNLLLNNKFLWFLIIKNYVLNNRREYRYDSVAAGKLASNSINRMTLLQIIRNMPTIVSIAKELKIELTNISDFISIDEMSQCADKSDIAILGLETIKRLFSETNYTDSDEEEIIRMAKDFICGIAKRNLSTVPYIHGQHLEYQYHTYDSLDESILLSGLDTDSCFRIDGNDNDFFHYCGLSKNGFAIKLTDYDGNFIGRAAGFRNGNGVYINQLRTIYDECGNNYKGRYKLEKAAIIATFRKACEDIVGISQNNETEKQKIDYVFVTKSYAMASIEQNVPEDVEYIIGGYPMDIKSEDWELFRKTAKNLKEDSDGFATDYGDYNLICMASSKDLDNIKVSDIKFGDVPPLYERNRNNIIIANHPDSIPYKKVNKIKAISCYYDETDYEEVIIPENSMIYCGDNWYIICGSDGEVIDNCLLEFDERAKKEFEATYKTIEESKVKALRLKQKIV